MTTMTIKETKAIETMINKMIRNAAFTEHATTLTEAKIYNRRIKALGLGIQIIQTNHI